MHINQKLAAGARRIITVAAILSGALSFCNAQNVENQIIASQFGQFKLYGVNDGFNFPPASCQLSAGNKNFVAFQQGVPVRVVDTGTPSLTETVTAGPVSITTCAVSLPVTHYHSSFYLTSGTAGLQEAINANGPGSFANTVILDNSWYALGGDGSIISSVKGYSNLGLVDVTQTPYVWYSWNGSQYVETATGGDVTSVFGRTGAVSAQTGDYTCDQVTNCGVAPNIAFNSPLSAAISSTDTTIPLSAPTSGLTVPGYVVMPGGEWIRYTGVSGDSLTGAIRGAHQTTAAAYGSGTYAYSVLSDLGNPAQAPQSYIVSDNGALPSITVLNCAVPDFTSNLSVQINCAGSYETYIDSGGAIKQNYGGDENIFDSETGIGPGGGAAPITNSGYLLDATRQNQAIVPMGFGAGLAGPVESIQPPTITAPGLTNFSQPSGSTTWSYECTGTDIDGNTFPGTVASITNGPATMASGEIIIGCPYAAGAATEQIWRTAGGPDQGLLYSSSVSGIPLTFPDTGAASLGGTPPSTNNSIPKACVDSGEVSCWITTASAPTGSCIDGWFDTNQSGSPTALYQCMDNVWSAVGGIAATSNQYGGVQTFGDSITFGQGTSNCGISGGTGSGGGGCSASPSGIYAPNSYAGLLLSAYGGNGANWGFSSDYAADAAVKITNNVNSQPSANLATTLMIGTNDQYNYGLNAALEAVFENAVEYSIAWVAIPNTNKIFFDDNSSCTLSANWEQQYTFIVTGLIDQYEGDTISCPIVTTGGPIYVSYLVTGTAATDGAATISVDGTVEATVNTVVASLPNTTNGLTWAPQIAAIRGIAAGTHTVLITQTGASTPTTYFATTWMASPAPTPSGTQAPPVIFVGGVPYEENDAGEPATGIYNGLVSNAVSQMQTDGLNAHFVDVRSFMNSTTDFNGGFVGNQTCPPSAANPFHPGNCGHLHIAQAFEASMQPATFLGGTVNGNLPIKWGNAAVSGSCNYSNPLYFNTDGSPGSILYICKPASGSGVIGTWVDIY